MQEVNGVFEWDAQAYHNFSDMQYHLALELLDKVSLDGDETVIDAGCGSGRVTVKILERLPRGKVIGVDLSQNMLAMAAEVVRPAPGQQVELMTGDLQTFSLPNAADGIFSSMAMHFVHDHGKMFHNLAETLRPGGWLAVQFAGPRPDPDPMEQVKKVLEGPPFGQYFANKFPAMHAGSVDASRAELTQAGFIDVDVRLITADLSESQREAMVAFFKSTFFGGPVAQLPTDALRAELNAKLEGVLEQAFDAPFDYLRCQARMPGLM